LADGQHLHVDERRGGRWSTTDTPLWLALVRSACDTAGVLLGLPVARWPTSWTGGISHPWYVLG
jgi:hypothetical protein